MKVRIISNIIFIVKTKNTIIIFSAAIATKCSVWTSVFMMKSVSWLPTNWGPKQKVIFYRWSGYAKNAVTGFERKLSNATIHFGGAT